MKILLLRTWSLNFGNNFIEKGAKACIRKAFPDSEIFEISSYSQLMNERNHTDSFIGVNEILGLTFFDLIIIPGCVMDEENLRRFNRFITNLREVNIPLIFLGVGGNNYKKKNLDYVKSTLKDIQNKFLITRDSIAFESYADEFNLSFEGIDCGFFINDWYNPPRLKKDIIAMTFDKIKEPKINTDKKIIRPSHNPFHIGFPFKEPLPFKGIIRIFLRRNKKKINSFVSDIIQDYLFIYANSSITYSDRVHACVVTLTYGNKAHLMYNTPRASLFNRLLDEDILKKPVCINNDRLSSEKINQIENLKKIRRYIKK